MERKLPPGTGLWRQVIDYLKVGYSPAQISGTLERMHSTTPSLQVSHETIYTAIYALPRGEDRRGNIPDGVSIHERPPEIEERLVPGH